MPEIKDFAIYGSRHIIIETADGQFIRIHPQRFTSLNSAFRAVLTIVYLPVMAAAIIAMACWSPPLAIISAVVLTYGLQCMMSWYMASGFSRVTVNDTYDYHGQRCDALIDACCAAMKFQECVDEQIANEVHAEGPLVDRYRRVIQSNMSNASH